MDLAAALDWLDGHVNLEASGAVAGRVEGLSLDRMRALCDVLGDPQHDYPVVHLTGTNGKGSTGRILTALLAAHDLTVGTYSSPHLERVNERIARNGEPIGDDDLAALLSDLERIEMLVEQRPSYFELLTAAGFRWFSDVAVSAAVVEVGMLGRWDATNVADGRVAVLTNVAADHTDGAPGWRRRVAEEKAGIVKPGSTFVVGDSGTELGEVFQATPAAEVLVRGADFDCESNRLSVGGRLLTIRTPHAVYDDVFLPLHGPHQGDNAAVAVAATEAFFGGPLVPEVLAEGLGAVTAPGRFEVVHRSPLVVLDGAHNPAAARAVVDTLDEGFGLAGDRRLVLGYLAGRDPVAFLTELGAASAAEVITCQPDTPRAVPAGELAAMVEALGGRARPVPDVGDALRRAVDDAGEGGVVLVTGSIYTAGEARRAARSL